MNLSEILHCFNSPIKEEQAWAVCYLCGKHLQSKESKEKPILQGTKSIQFDKDGHVTIVGKLCSDEIEIVSSLGLTLFSALDHGLSSDEEQVLSEDLDHLISVMTEQFPSSDDDPDEGYADGKTPHPTVHMVVDLCEKHLSPSIDAGSHYLAVCRALVHEALELKLFLSKITSANENLHKLTSDKQEELNDEETSLNFTQWAHVWMQVLDDLRKGVTRLRRVDRQTKAPIEYELTPYEILMEDIRQRKYTLKKVYSSDEWSLRMKKNAHDVILEFIKSRPSLSPAHERVLGPIPLRPKTLHERLIEQIHNRVVPLKHVDVTSPRHGKRRSTETIEATSSRNRRRLKPGNLEEIESVTSFQSDSDVEDLALFVSDGDVTGDLSSLQLTCNDDSNISLRSSEHSGVSSSAGDVSSTHRPNKLQSPAARRKRLLPLELPPSPPHTPESALPRRGSFLATIFASFRRPTGVRRSQSAFADVGQTGNQLSSRENMPTCPEEEEPDLTSTPLPASNFRRTLSERRTRLQQALSRDCDMRLSLDEIAHIRQVLSRAQLEKYQFSSEIYKDLKSEKICFSCRSRRFSFFVWPYSCHMCKRKVCVKCLKKAYLPHVQSSETLLFSLSPALTPMIFESKEAHRRMSFSQPNSNQPNDTKSSSRGKKMDVCLDCHVIINTGFVTKVN